MNSIETEILRLKKSKSMVAAAERLKLSGVRSWKRCNVYGESTDGAGGTAYSDGSGIFNLAPYKTNVLTVEGISAYLGGEYCIVVLPVENMEDIGHIEFIDQNEYEDGVTITTDLTLAGTVSYDIDFSSGELYFSLKLSSTSEENWTRVFVGVYGTASGGPDNDTSEYWYVDGTESIDELAVSIYKWKLTDSKDDTTNATVTAADVRKNKTCYAKGKKIVGTLSDFTNNGISVGENSLFIDTAERPGHDLTTGIYKNVTVGFTAEVQDTLTAYDRTELQLASI